MQDRIPINQALEETGLKKKFIAEKLGINPNYLKQYLSNARNISIENAAIICELTGKKINQLDFGLDETGYI